jgi:ribosomal protein L11 methyltransferase
VAEARWLEVSLKTDGELAEAVAEVLSRFVTNGVVAERGMTHIGPEDRGTPTGPVRVYGYLPMDEHLEDTRQRLVEALWHLGQIQPLPAATFRTIEDQDWTAAFKKHYHPIPLGRRMMVLPAWIEHNDPKRVPIHIDPSMAFGTGTHPTTQLCLELLEDHINPGTPIIDIGCGSGILSIAALKLGASHALAVDVDRAAVRATLDNSQNNKVIDQVETGLGSVEEIIQGQYSYSKAPLVIANILAPIIIHLFETGLTDLLDASGVLLLSGILDEQVDTIQETAAANGLKIIDHRQIKDWVALALTYQTEK